jgi:K319-like protein
MKQKLLLVLFVTLGFFFTSNVIAQNSSHVKVANNYELVRAMNNPDVISVEITKDGFYESLGENIVNGTVVTLGEYIGGSRAACTLSISKTDGCFVTGTADGIVTASTSGDPSCPPTPTSSPYGWTVTNKPSGATVVFNNPDLSLEMDFTVDMPGQYTLKYSWDDFNEATTNVFFWSTPTVTVTPQTPVCGEQTFIFTTDAGSYPGPQSMEQLWEVTDGSFNTVTVTTPSSPWTFDPTTYPSLDQCGDYTLDVVVTNPANGADCSSADSDDFYIYDTPAGVDAGSDQTEVCAVGVVLSTTLTGNPGSVSCDNSVTPTVAWVQTAGPGTSTFTASTSNSTDVTATLCGTYTYSFTVTNGNCTTTETVDITYFDLPTSVDAGTAQDVCQSGGTYSTSLSGSFVAPSCGSTSVAWTQLSGPNTATITNGTTLSPSISDAACGSYTFQMAVTNETSCTVTSTVTVGFYDLATDVDANDDQEVCEVAGVFSTGLVGSYTASSCGSNYVEWTHTGGTGSGTISFSNDAIDEPTVTSTACGTYILRYTVYTGGPASCDTYDEVSVTFYDLPDNVDAGTEQDVCEVMGVYGTTLSGSYDAVSCGSTAVAWTQISGATALITGGTTLTPSIIAPSCGTYEFQMDVTNGGLCTVSSTVTVNFYDLATDVDAGMDQEVCEGSGLGKTPVDYLASVTGSYTVSSCGANSVLWEDAGTGSGTGTLTFGTPTANTTTVTSTACGEYVLNFVVSTGGPTSCETVSSTTIYFYDLPTNVDAGSIQDVCEVAGEFSTSLLGSYDALSCDAGPTPSSVEWTYFSGPDATPTFSASTSNATDVEVDLCGTYVFAYAVTNGPSCTVSNTVTVVFYDLPTGVGITADDKVCGLTTDLAGDYTNSCFSPTVTWSQTAGPGTSSFTASGSDDTDVTVTECGEYTFEYEVSQMSGCATVSSTTITFFDIPDPVIVGNDEVYTCSTVTYTVNDLATCNDQDLITYSWTVTGGLFDAVTTTTTGTSVSITWDQYTTSGTLALVASVDPILSPACETTATPLTVTKMQPTLEGQLKYWNEFETYMPTPFPTDFNGAYPQDYFYVEFYDGTDALRDSYISQPNLMVGASGQDSSLMSYYGFTIPTVVDGCSGSYYVKVWDGGLVYDPAAPSGSGTNLGASYTYNNWGGVNATDAYAIQLMAAGSDLNSSYPWVGLTSDSPMYGFYSNDIADVNTSGTTITALDALIVNYRAVGLLASYPNSGMNLFSPNFAVAGRMVSALPEMTWDDYFASCVTKAVFCDDIEFAHSEEDYMYYDDAIDHKYTSTSLPLLPEANFMNIYYSSEGDINASNVPTSGGFKSQSTMELVYEDLAGTDVEAVLTIPVRIDSRAELNAISLFMNFRNDLIEVIETNYAEDFVSINNEEGILNIGWFSVDTKDVDADDIIAQIKVRVLAEIPEGTELFQLNANTELADATATPISDLTLKTIGVTTDKVGFSGGTELASSNYPNPFDNRTTITYTLPESGKVKVQVINSMGTVIANLVEEVQEAGIQSLVYNTELNPGVYFYTITLQGEVNTYSVVERMIVVN